VLRDNVTGEEVDRKKGHVLAHVPYFTERHTFILGGNEYELPHQVRLDAGVYTRERGNGELETSFNLSKGKNFKPQKPPIRCPNKLLKKFAFLKNINPIFARTRFTIPERGETSSKPYCFALIRMNALSVGRPVKDRDKAW
jgi:hypothetical protein